MELSAAEMLDRSRARDRAFDGRFLTGVVTTGIYCLPSCPARQPKPENVRFFGTEAEARAAGLRPCQRCHPDRFHAGSRPEVDAVAQLEARVRAAPGDYPSVLHLARAAETGVTRLRDLIRLHFQLTPAAWLGRIRVESARSELLHGQRRILDVALDAGFDSASAFHENFRRHAGMTPQSYRRLRDADGFTLALPHDFRHEHTLAQLRRKAGNGDERGSGRHFTKVLLLDGRTAELTIELRSSDARCRVDAVRPVGPAGMARAHEVAFRLLGLGTDSAAFERRFTRDKTLRRLAGAHRGLRIPLTADVYEGLCWAILGQQINVAFARTCRARLVELCGRRVRAGVFAHPTPAAVAGLDPCELITRQISRRKAEYLIDVSRKVAGGELPLEELPRGSAVEAERILCATRGIGPWTASYTMMRACGFADCVPVGDAGLTAALAGFFELAERPGPAETLALMAPFAPHRSLCTFHLWRNLGEKQAENENPKEKNP